jgi:N-acetylmuramoyl-L-alanine amidase
MIYKVGVDDGHGLETAGKRTPDGYKENEFNHFTKEYLKAELKRCGIEVIDCSPNRTDNSLSNRCDIANNAKCNIFVSIHFNAMGDNWQNVAGGIETYYYPGSLEGQRLAGIVQSYLLQGTVMQDRHIKSANFAVLRETIMPAILVECGFMDNPREAALMKSDLYRKECSIEIAKGICKYAGIPYIAASNNSNKSERDSGVERIQKVSKWANIYIKEFDALQARGINVWGLINKLK